MTKTYFKFAHRLYLSRSDDGGITRHLWSIPTEKCMGRKDAYYLGFAADGNVCALSHEARRTLPWDVDKGADRLYRMIGNGVENTYVYTIMGGMARIRNADRDIEIAFKKDKQGWSFREIARYFNMAVSSVFEAYHRGVRLSTGKKLQGVR